MHDGSFDTLDDVVDFYSNGARQNPDIDPVLRQLNLSNKEKKQLVAFLRALSGTIQGGIPRRNRGAASRSR